MTREQRFIQIPCILRNVRPVIFLTAVMTVAQVGFSLPLSASSRSQRSGTQVLQFSEAEALDRILSGPRAAPTVRTLRIPLEPRVNVVPLPSPYIDVPTIGGSGLLTAGGRLLLGGSDPLQGPDSVNLKIQVGTAPEGSALAASQVSEIQRPAAAEGVDSAEGAAAANANHGRLVAKIAAGLAVFGAAVFGAMKWSKKA